MDAVFQLLASLVHRGRIAESDARSAMQSDDPLGWLVENGKCSEQERREWERTQGDEWPELSRYDLLELLGEGGSARVFRAADKVEGNTLALKILRADMAEEPSQVESFVREARLLLDLQHEHLVKGLRVAKEGGTFFFAMEELSGRCLQDLLAESGRLDEATALEVVLQVASALEVLHERGLVHRDVKPGNIVWSEERGAVLIDLGFAVPRSASGQSGETTAGTVHYIAPEQARGSAELDVRADIYALGATLYHLVTGSLPFDGASNHEVLAKQVLESLNTTTATANVAPAAVSTTATT